MITIPNKIWKQKVKMGSDKNFLFEVFSYICELNKLIVHQNDDICYHNH